MSNDSFNLLLQKLNPQQRVAVTTIEGPVMVIAGPGTGKTHVLACRIATILAKQDVEPRNILALTFTDAAAKNMRQRIVSMIGPAGYHVAISTFHSFCSEVIAEHPEYFDLARESQPLTDLERYSLFEELLLNTNLDVLRPLSRPLYYIKQVQSSISDLKREGISPDDFEAILLAEETVLEEEREELKKTELKKREKNLAKQKELHTLYVKYQVALQNRNRYDFDDMVNMVAEAFQSQELLLAEYQEQLQYILVDEYQDTNASQNKVVDLLASFWGEDANIFVVGDPHQSIFRFQGASVENMLGFLDRYPTAKVVTLTVGYRCPQNIYDAAHTSIVHNVFSLDKKSALAPEQDQVLQQALSTRLNSPKQASNNQAIRLYTAPTQMLEHHFIVEEIKKLVAKNVSLSEIAILYKNHADAEELIGLLIEENIPFETDHSGNIFDDQLITQLLEVIRVIAGVSDTENSRQFFEVMLFEWLNLPTVAVLQTTRIASKLRKPFVEVLEMDVDSLASEYSLDIDGFVSLQAFKTKLEELRAMAVNMQFHAWFEILISDEGLGFYSWLVSQAKNKEHLLTLNSLFSEIKKWVSANKHFSLQDFLSAVDTMIEHNLVLKAQTLQTTTKKVTICSVHKAKGQEWEYVYVMALRDKKWGNTRQRKLLPLPAGILKHVDVSKQEENEEDRRLFYVAITRAKKQTTLSFAESEVDGKAIRTFIKSMFLTEIQSHVNDISAQYTEELSAQVEEKLAAPLQVSDRMFGTAEREFYASLVQDFTLSVTALNNYLKDPKEFVYNSLLRVPRAKEPHMSFGTAMHAALEELYTHVSNEEGRSTLSLAETQKVFSKVLLRESLPDEDFTLWNAKGLEALETYYAVKNKGLQKPLFTERFFGGIFGNTVLTDGDVSVALSGRLDRIDLLDAHSKTVRLVDYKTGKAKSQNAIEANTQTALTFLSEREQDLPESIRGAYKRQLIFYVLLAQLDESFPYTVTDTMFEFVEPTSSGKIVTRSFLITQDEVQLLKELIIEVMQEIRSLKFLDAITQPGVVG